MSGCLDDAELWRDHLVELHAPPARVRAGVSTRDLFTVEDRLCSGVEPLSGFHQELVPPARNSESTKRFDIAPALVDRTMRHLAELCDVSRSTVQRWARSGVDEWSADRVAMAVGVHPAELWPDWLYPEIQVSW